MAPWLSNHIFIRVSMAINPSAVQEYRGDSIASLSERPEDHFLLNSKSLKKCTDWFQPRGNFELYNGPANTLEGFDPLTKEEFPIYTYYMSGFLEEKHAMWLLHSDVSPYSSGLAPCMDICPEGDERSRKCKYSGPIIDTDMTTNFVGQYSNQNWSWFHDRWEFSDISSGYKASVKEDKTMFRLMFGPNPSIANQQMDLLSGETGADCISFRKPGGRPG